MLAWGARHLAAALCPQEARARVGGERELVVGHWAGNCALAAGFARLATTGRRVAHPHVWVTVKSQIAFTPDGKVSAVVHDWVFDEMYSSFATQGLAPARRNSSSVSSSRRSPRRTPASLAEIGYFTTLKIGGKAVDFGSVTDYWMQERPDHLVEFHVTLPLKTPRPWPSSSRFASPIRNISSISNSTTRIR